MLIISLILSSALLVSGIQKQRIRPDIINVIEDLYPEELEALDKRLGLYEVYQEKVVGGERAKDGEFPYIVSIQIKSNLEKPNATYHHICGGVVLTKHSILTAAHCSAFIWSRYRIVAGVNNLDNLTNNTQIVKVGRIIRHTKYNESNVDYDAAIIRVFPGLNFTEYVTNVTLPADSDFEPTGHALSSGWGILNAEDKTSPARLQKIELPLVPWKECEEIYNSVNLTITNRMLCAGMAEGRNVCNGDSGGPLICFNSEKPFLCGLVSWGIPCALEGYPTVFTRVSSIQDFIRKNVPRVQFGLINVNINVNVNVNTNKN